MNRTVSLKNERTGVSVQYFHDSSDKINKFFLRNFILNQRKIDEKSEIFLQRKPDIFQNFLRFPEEQECILRKMSNNKHCS